MDKARERAAFEAFVNDDLLIPGVVEFGWNADDEPWARYADESIGEKGVVYLENEYAAWLARAREDDAEVRAVLREARVEIRCLWGQWAGRSCPARHSDIPGRVGEVLVKIDALLARIEGHPWFNQDSEGAGRAAGVGDRGSPKKPAPSTLDAKPAEKCSSCGSSRRAVLGFPCGMRASQGKRVNPWHAADAKPADAVVVTDAMVERAAVALAHFDIRSVRGATDSWRMIWIKWDEDAKEEVATEEVRDIYRREARAALEAALNGGGDEQK